MHIKRIIAFLMSAVFLCLSFWLLNTLFGMEVELNMVFPEDANCKVIEIDYGSRLKDYAYEDWKFV